MLESDKESGLVLGVTEIVIIAVLFLFIIVSVHQALKARRRQKQRHGSADLTGSRTVPKVVVNDAVTVGPHLSPHHAPFLRPNCNLACYLCT